MENFFAPCPRGLEAMLAQELTALGATGVEATDGGVHFAGSFALCYRANLESRLASRVLWRIALKRLDHDQHHGRDQNQRRDFIEPAQPDMALAVAVVLEVEH